MVRLEGLAASKRLFIASKLNIGAAVLGVPLIGIAADRKRSASQPHASSISLRAYPRVLSARCFTPNGPGSPSLGVTRKRIEAERAELKTFPERRTTDYEEAIVHVTSAGGFIGNVGQAMDQRSPGAATT
jgi:hypothetical protein